MNKHNFEIYLRENLAILKDSEVNEIISEYLQHIEMKQADGISEEAAIKDFGDLDDLVSEILDAYKINTSKDKYEDLGNTIKNGLNKGLNFINKITSSLMNRSGRQMFSLVVEFIVVLLIIGVFNFAIDVFASSISRMFYFRPHFITSGIRFLIRLLKTILGLTISLSVLYWFVYDRILNQEVPQPELKVKDNYKKTVSSEDVNFNQDVDLDFKTNKNHANSESFSKKLWAANTILFKIIGFIILIPMIVVGVLLGLFLLTVLYNTVIGYGSVGISLILIGVAVIYYYLIILGLKLVGGGQSKWKRQL